MLNNYTYILQNINGSLLTFEEYKNVYETIILKYHYPLCLNITNILTEAEKNSIKTNEFQFIKSKLSATIQIYQLPRVLYDLFFILYNCVVLYNRKINIQNFYNEQQPYIDYCNKLNNFHAELSENIFGLNNFIITFLLSLEDVDYKTPKYKDYSKILDAIVSQYDLFINETFVDKKREYYDTNTEEFIKFITNHLYDIWEGLFSKKYNFTIFFNKINETQSYVNNLYIKEIFLSIIESITENIKFIKENNKLMEQKTQILDLIKSILHDRIRIHAIIYDNRNAFDSKYNFKIFVKNLNIKLLKNTLIQETIGAEKDGIVLYRGARDGKELGIDENAQNRGYSISYNSSLLNGVLTDITACTYKFMTDETIIGNIKLDIKTNKLYKHKYVLNKFFYGDNSEDDNLFFIPPLHPYLQMMSSGEFWHPRSKIYNGSTIHEISTFAGLYNEIKGIVGVNFDKFPDYLTSRYDRAQFDTEFKKFIVENRSIINDDEGHVSEDTENEYLVFYDARAEGKKTKRGTKRGTKRRTKRGTKRGTNMLSY